MAFFPVATYRDIDLSRCMLQNMDCFTVSVVLVIADKLLGIVVRAIV